MWLSPGRGNVWAWGKGGRSRSKSGAWLASTREVHIEGSPRSRVGLHGQGGAIQSHDAGDDGQPQSRADVLFRREERLEDSVTGGFVHAAAGVLHAQADVVAGRRGADRFGRFRVQVHGVDANLDAAVAGVGRIAGVEQQVNDELFDVA